MANRAKDNRERSQLTRACILEALQAAVDRERGDKESPSTYVDESLLYAVVGPRFPQTLEMLRGELYYLRDKGYVKFKEVKIGAKKSLMWRVTACGTDLVEETKEDPGVRFE